MGEDDEGPCTDCWDTGWTVQTERPCACTPPMTQPETITMTEQQDDLVRELQCIKRDGSWAASVRLRDQHPVCRRAAQALATARAEAEALREALRKCADDLDLWSEVMERTCGDESSASGAVGEYRAALSESQP